MKSPIRLRIWSSIMLAGHQRTAYAFYCAFVSPYGPTTCVKCDVTKMSHPFGRRRFITHFRDITTRSGIVGHQGGAICLPCHAGVCDKQHRRRHRNSIPICKATWPGLKSAGLVPAPRSKA